jgi:bilirubin oxidase
MFHCHNLRHEDSMMMASFNVTRLETLGYDNVESLDNPDDPRFVAQDWSADVYSDDQIQSKLNYLGNLGAYNERDQLVNAVASYYSNNPNPPVETGTTEAAGSTQTQGGGQSWQNSKGSGGNQRGGNQRGGRPWQR